MDLSSADRKQPNREGTGGIFASLPASASFLSRFDTGLAGLLSRSSRQEMQPCGMATSGSDIIQQLFKHASAQQELQSTLQPTLSHPTSSQVLLAALAQVERPSLVSQLYASLLLGESSLHHHHHQPTLEELASAAVGLGVPHPSIRNGVDGGDLRWDNGATLAIRNEAPSSTVTGALVELLNATTDPPSPIKREAKSSASHLSDGREEALTRCPSISGKQGLQRSIDDHGNSTIVLQQQRLSLSPHPTASSSLNSSAQNSPQLATKKASLLRRQSADISSCSTGSASPLSTAKYGCSTPTAKSGFAARGNLTPQRKPAAPIPPEKKDASYYERRRKNNDAAKRSRDARRQKEEETMMRAAFLVQENSQLKTQIEILKAEVAKLQGLLLASAGTVAPRNQAFTLGVSCCEESMPGMMDVEVSTTMATGCSGSPNEGGTTTSLGSSSSADCGFISAS